MPIPKFGNAQLGSGVYENSFSALLAPFPPEIKLRDFGIGLFLAETKRSPFLADISALPPHYLFHVYTLCVDGFRSCGDEDSGDKILEFEFDAVYLLHEQINSITYLYEISHPRSNSSYNPHVYGNYWSGHWCCCFSLAKNH